MEGTCPLVQFSWAYLPALGKSHLQLVPCLFQTSRASSSVTPDWGLGAVPSVPTMAAEIAALVWDHTLIALAWMGSVILALILSFFLAIVAALVWWTSIRVQPPVPGAADGHQTKHFP